MRSGSLPAGTRPCLLRVFCSKIRPAWRPGVLADFPRKNQRRVRPDTVTIAPLESGERFPAASVHCTT